MLTWDSYLGSRFPRHRLYIAMAFIVPSIAGNAILWKAAANNLHALLGGLYIVCAGPFDLAVRTLD